MMHKQPAILFSSCNAFGPVSICTAQASPTSFLPRQWERAPRPRLRACRPRGVSQSYATVASEDAAPHKRSRKQTEKEENVPHWPQVDASRLPTPYQILNCQPGAVYSKVHFYRLVKLYHPDRHGYKSDQVSSSSSTSSPSAPPPSSISSIPHHVRLERYRLIVTAHTILSDPAKRRLYDAFGTGWAGRPEHGGGGIRFGMEREPPRWWPPGQDPMYNATWEDWETWYQQQREREQQQQQQQRQSGAEATGEDGRGGKQAPQRTLLMNNYAFVSLIVMFAALGGVGQATRAQQYGSSYVEQRKEANDRTHADLMTVRGHAAGSSREQKVERFLKARDGAAFADDGTRRMLMEPDICESARLEDGRGSYGTATRRAG